MAAPAGSRRISPQLRLSIPSLSFPRLYPSFSPSAVEIAVPALSPFMFSTSTPSKPRRLPSSSSYFSSLLLLLFSLRSLYSLFPFLRSSPPGFSLFPFSFLVSLFSFLLSFSMSLPKIPSVTLTLSLLRPLVAKSFLLALVFLLRFHSLRFCSAGASILAEVSGALLARSLSEQVRRSRRRRRIVGFLFITIALILLSYSWDLNGCFPFSVNVSSSDEGCGRVAAILLSFFSGFLGFHERVIGNFGTLKQLGKRSTRLGSLALSTAILFFPACISLFMQTGGDNGSSSISMADMTWPLINTVIFGVVLNDNFSGDEKSGLDGKEPQKEFLVTFFCTLVLELVYSPKLSFPGFFICGFFLWLSIRELSSSSIQHVELGNMDSSETMYALVMNPIRHILSERKTRKIALFLLINTGYMIVEFTAGFISNSLGLISDACHMLFDCAALAIGLYASYISLLPANNQFNFGRRRFEVLSGYANAVFLVLVGALIVLESIERILSPQEISTSSLLTVSIGGLAVNIVGLVFFHEEHHHAHGGDGSCSHSHSHGNSHGSVDYISNKNEHHHSNSSSSLHFNDISHDHSNVGNDNDFCNNEHSPSHPHQHHHHLHGNQRDHQREHDDHHLMHHVEDRLHHDSCKHSHEHQNLLTGIKEEGLKMHYHIDHNMEGIFLHVLADTMGSVGVVISTLLIKYKGWVIADPACSIFISVMIIFSVIPLLRNTAEILLQRIPRNLEHNLRLVRENIMKIEGVCGVRNLHVWSFSNKEIVGTVHLYVSSESDRVLIKKRAFHLFHEAGVKDITIQIECIDDKLK